MPINVLMPALSPTMTEGKLSKWVKKEGDKIKSGDIIAEIETDKATMEFEAVDEGILGKILVAEGTEGVAVNTPIGVILEEGEDASSIKETKPAAEPAKAAEEKPKAEEKSAPAPSPAPSPAPAPAPTESKAAAPAAQGDRLFATPLAKRVAKDAGVDLKAIKGSGPHGRIIKADVEFAKSQPGPSKAVAAAGPAVGTPPAAAQKAAAPAPAWGPAYEEVPLTSMRKVIARRLTEAKQTVPHFYLTIDYKLDNLLALRSQLNAKSDTKLSVNDFVIRASALALKKVPAANASFTDTALRMYKDIDISVAVATPNGLITPIIKHADQKGLAQISAEMKDLAARAKEGKLKPEEFQGGTFSISNLGMFGIKDFAAIINPPQGCILAVGAGEQRPVVVDGALAIATVMSCTLSVDHRVVDGAVGAEYLAALKGLIEDPLTMLL